MHYRRYDRLLCPTKINKRLAKIEEVRPTLPWGIEEEGLASLEHPPRPTLPELSGKWMGWEVNFTK